MKKWKDIFKRSTMDKNSKESVSQVNEENNFAERELLGLLSFSPRGKIINPEYGGLVFLIIEDNLDLQVIIIDFLKKHGAIVESAANGKIGLDKYLSNASKYNLILLDYQMPVMNGIDTAKSIRESGLPNAKNIPIILMSGSQCLTDTRGADCNFFMQKPFEMKQLIVAINQFL